MAHIIRKDVYTCGSHPWTLTWPGAPMGVYRFREFSELQRFLNDPEWRRQLIQRNRELDRIYSR